MGPFEKEAREFLGERTPGIPESQYLFSLAELVRTREKFFRASQRVGGVTNAGKGDFIS